MISDSPTIDQFDATVHDVSCQGTYFHDPSYEPHMYALNQGGAHQPHGPGNAPIPEGAARGWAGVLLELADFLIFGSGMEKPKYYRVDLECVGQVSFFVAGPEGFDRVVRFSDRECSYSGIVHSQCAFRADSEPTVLLAEGGWIQANQTRTDTVGNLHYFIDLPTTAEACCTDSVSATNAPGNLVPGPTVTRSLKDFQQAPSCQNTGIEWSEVPAPEGPGNVCFIDNTGNGACV